MNNITRAFSEEVGMMNSSWCVNPDHTLMGNPVVVFIKRCVRKMIRFFVVQNVEAQNEFNGHVTRAFNSLVGMIREQNVLFGSIMHTMPVECMEIFVDIVNNNGMFSGGIIDANRY